MKSSFAALLLLPALGASGSWVHAAEVQVAVASNFAGPMQRLAAAFEQETGHRAILAYGATGKFYAQVRNGAPYELLLAADAATPARLVSEGLVVRGTGFTYATGRLALWSAHEALVDARATVLDGSFAHLAIANPRTAPYGAAAVEVLRNLGRYDSLKGRLVQGENIAQAYQFVSTGNATLGFVALSEVYRGGRFSRGSGWIVPAHLHAPIRQDAVILARGAANPAARALTAFLRSDKARAIIRFYGYEC